MPTLLVRPLGSIMVAVARARGCLALAVIGASRVVAPGGGRRPHTKGWAAVGLVTLSLLPFPPAVAGPPRRPDARSAGVSDGPPAPAIDPAEERREAGRAFRRGVEAYGVNDFETAVREFEAANALVAHPDTLYNLGLAVLATGNTRRAFALFSEVERTAADPELVREARRALQDLRLTLGVVVVHTAPGSIVCVDGQLVVPHGSGLHEVGLAPGTHDVAVHDVNLQVELRAGEARTLWLDRVDGVSDRRRQRTSRALTGTAIGFAALASGLAIAAVAADDSPREGFEIGAAASGVVSVGTLIALLAHERAHAKGRAKRRVAEALLEMPQCTHEP